jgi:GNAT superfamily N-acetyltransferase
MGYCIFRWDTEETASEDGDGLCDVAYWCGCHSLFPSFEQTTTDAVHCANSYELQVDSTAQRLGVGKALMDALKRLGKAYRMDKVILTVFKGSSHSLSPPLPLLIRASSTANDAARGFYERTGCVLPCRGGRVDLRSSTFLDEE